MNRKGDIAITLLVVMALVTAGVASFIFLTSSKKLEGKIYDSRSLDIIYSEADKLNFYIDEILNAGVIKTSLEIADVQSEDFKLKLVGNLLDELNKYKNKEGGFIDSHLVGVEQKIKEITPENLVVENGNVFLTLNLLIKIDQENVLTIYAYTKTFREEIPVQENI